MMMEGVECIRSPCIDDYLEWLDTLFESGGVSRLLSQSLSRDRHGTGMRAGAITGDESTALLFVDSFVSLHLRWLPALPVTRGSARVVSTAASDSLLMPFAGGALRYARYAVHGIDVPDVFSRAARVELSAAGSCRQGAVLRIPAQHACVSLRALAPGAYVLQVSARPSQRIVWTFDARTGKALSSHSASIEATRDQLSCKALAAMRAGDPCAILCVVAREHSFHFVRMQALRALHTLGYSELIALLHERAELDPHPHVRTACIKNLAARGTGNG